MGNDPKKLLLKMTIPNSKLSVKYASGSRFYQRIRCSIKEKSFEVNASSVC
jgi:hypothetical protein